MVRLLAITQPDFSVAEPVWLARAEAVHRALRPQLPADYVATMRTIFADRAEMLVAIVDETVVGLAVYRCFHNTFSGRRFYIDDLVTDDAQRSQGVGHAMMDWLEAEARRRGVKGLELESGTQRTQAHKFYFREGFVINSFSFRKPFK